MFPLLSAQTSLCRQILTKNQLPKYLYNLSAENNISPRWTSTSSDQKPKPFKKIPGLGLIRSLVYSIRHARKHEGDMLSMWVKLFERYGPIFRLKFPGQPLVIVMEPEDIKYVYKLTENDPRRPETHEAMAKIRRNNGDIFHNGKSLGLTLEVGEEWKRVRSLVQAHLLKPKAVSLYLPQMDLVTREFISYLKKSEWEGKIKPKSFYEDLRKLASENIALVTLNRKMGCFDTDKPLDPYSKEFVELGGEFFDLFVSIEKGPKFYKLYRTEAFRRYEFLHDRFLKLTIRGIEEAEEAIKTSKAAGDSGKNATILEKFLNTEGLKRTDLIAVVADLFIAGVDTVTATLVFTLYQLAKNPKCQKKLQEEIDSVLSYSTDITYEQINQMTYLDKIFREAMRMNNVATGSARTLVKDEVIRGFVVPEGINLVMMNFLANKQRENYYKPEKFIPERWNRDRPYGEIHPYCALPFSTGRRMCIGKRIAMQEMNLFIIRLLRTYTVTLDPPSTTLKLKSDLVLRPAGDLPFVFKRRHNIHPLFGRNYIVPPFPLAGVF